MQGKGEAWVTRAEMSLQELSRTQEGCLGLVPIALGLQQQAQIQGTDLHNLAVAVRALGRTDEAGMLLRRALEATVATLGADHEDAAVLRSRLAEWSA